MSTLPEQTTKPALHKTLDEIERRVKVIEHGDPYDIANARAQLALIGEQIWDIGNRLGALEASVADLSAQLGVVHDSSNARDQTLYLNDSSTYTHLTAYSPPLRTWQNSTLASYIQARADWAVAYHQWAWHPSGGVALGGANPGSAPGWTPPPVIPAWPIIADPNP
jgi:hypothetical protein